LPRCPKCGKEVYPNAIRCYYCGQSLPRRSGSEIRRNDAIIALVLIVAITVTVYYAGTAFLKQTNLFFQTPQQGTLSIQSYQIFQNNPDYVSVTLANNGTKDLTVTAAYIDGIQAPVSGSLSLGAGQTKALTVTEPSGVNITDGALHNLKIVPSDGTPLVVSIVKQ
jgi:hypothetical protein